ncbi:MAG: helix-turn-helix domain-containing protein [Bauldia sp.]|nr:helix-turn-helix domain-containing protein [Bauldia sp.]
MSDPDGSIDQRIGDRLRALRARHGFTLDDLAARAAVSRAMLSRIERGDSSPTAQLLGKVCAGLGITLSELFADEPEPSPVRRRRDQSAWRDPASGYIRRNVSPSGTGTTVSISEVELPPGARVAFDSLQLRGADQHIWVFDGVLELAIGDDRHRLDAGDCIHMDFARPVTFLNPGRRPVRYAVVIGRRGLAG